MEINLHLVNFDDYGDNIFLDFDRKMGKEKATKQQSLEN